MKKVNIYLIGFLCSFIFAIVIFLVFLLDLPGLGFLKSNSEIYYKRNISFKLPYLSKLGALIERERSYKVFIEEIVGKEDSDERRIKEIFDSIKNFPTVSDLEGIEKALPNQYKFINTTQHEYQVLIKQYGQAGEQALNFCNLMAIAGHPSSPVYPHTALVIVRSKPDNFLYFDFDKRKMIKSEEISGTYRKMCEEKLNELDKSSRIFFRGDYLHGYAQISWYRFWYSIFPWRAMKDYLTTEPPPAYLTPQ